LAAQLELSTGAYDLILLDLSLPDTRGANLLMTMRAGHPDIPVVIVSGQSEKATIVSCLEQGAMGFIPKTSSREVLLNAIRLVLSGGVYVPGEALLPDVTKPAPVLPLASGSISSLSPRQMDVMRLLLKGLPNKLIARQLDIAENTVKIHVSAVLKELGAQSRTEALLIAHRMGISLA
jgi:DNA-binding NarL/FixJ family response regulator